MQIGSVPVGTVLSGVGVLGALLWVARWAVGGDALLWAGAGLLTVLAGAAGAGLVRPVPLRIVVGTCVALLCWSLGAVLGLDGDPVRAGVAGLVLVVLVPVWWERTRPLPQAQPARRNRHAAGTSEPAPAGSAEPVAPAAPAGPRRRAERRSRAGR